MSLICNVQRTSKILENVGGALGCGQIVREMCLERCARGEQSRGCAQPHCARINGGKRTSTRSKSKFKTSAEVPNVVATLQVFDVLEDMGINVLMMSQGASKTNISLVVEGADGTRAVQALHKRFFEELPHNRGAARQQ